MFSFMPTANDHKVKIDPSIVVFSVFFVLLLLFLYAIRSILVLVFMAFILMVALNPIVEKLHNKLKFSRFLAIIFVYICFISIISTIIAFLIPPLVSQMYQLVKLIDVPVIQQEIAHLKFSLNEISDLVSRVGGSVNMVYSLISSTFSGVFTFVTLLILSFYLILDRPVLHKKIAWFTSNELHFKLTRNILDSLELQLGGWIRAQFILMTLIGVFSYFGLTIFGVPFALPLAILAGLLEVLPNLGPTISAVPAIAIAYINLGPASALAVLGLYVIIQQLENNIIVPKVLKDNADVNPLVAILSIIIGLKLGGAAGALLAVPSYIVLRTLYSTWKNNRDKIST